MSKLELALIAVGAVVNLLNALTSHWTNHKGFRRGLLYVTEFLSVVSSKGNGGLKLPGKVY